MKLDINTKDVDFHALDKKFGMDGQYIRFNPEIEKDLQIGDIIKPYSKVFDVWDEEELRYVDENTFVIPINEPGRYITGYTLLVNKWEKV